MLVDWLDYGLCSASYSIMINSTPSDFFSSIIDILQGYPLSHYLFIYYADVLFWILWVAASSSGLDPYMSASGAQPIFQLLFIDDCLLMDQVSIRNAVAFSKILEKYCQVSE